MTIVAEIEFRTGSLGPRPHARRLDWDEAIRLRALGLTYREIGDRLGVSDEQIRRACAGGARQDHGIARVVLRDAYDRLSDKFVFASDGCWIWTSTITKKGYGRFWFGARSHRAHRFMYELLVGPIPDGLVLDHLCCETRCVNPAHLEPVTAAENSRRAAASPRKGKAS